MLPLLLFLFLGMTNFGFFVYAFITVGNAARVGAQYTSSSALGGNQFAACQAVLREMAALSNVYGLGSGKTSDGTWTSSNACTAAPLTVTAAVINSAVTANTDATKVTVTYDTIQLFPLPFMSGKMTINRTATMRLMD